jgi:hypothetical protein
MPSGYIRDTRRVTPSQNNKEGFSLAWEMAHVASDSFDPHDHQRHHFAPASTSVYHYHDVPAEAHAELMDAPSIGSHLAARIKPKYRAERVEQR